MNLSTNLQKISLILLAVFGFCSVYATNYYVNATLGRDTYNGLTVNTAKQTIQAASNLTNPGDTVFIMNGTYLPIRTGVQDILDIKRSGTATKYITYKAYPGHTPKLKGSINLTWQVWCALAIDASYIIVDGIEIEGNNANLTYQIGYQGYLDYINGIKDFVKLSRTEMGGVSIGKNLPKKITPSQAVHHIIVRNCIIHDCGGSGGSKCDYVTFENNRIYNNCWYSYNAGSGLSILGPVDIDTVTSYKIFMKNNIVYNNKTLVPWERIKALSDGNGIILDINNGTQNGDTFSYNGRYLIYNNICYNNGGGGIHAYIAKHIDVINNTCYNNGTVVGYPEMDANASSDVKFYNNIMYARTGASCNANDAGIYDYNLYYNGNVFKPGNNSVIANPQFINLAIDSTGIPTANFQLKNFSPAINAGSKVNGQFSPTDLLGINRPFGTRPDIGAYEFTGVQAGGFVKGDLAALRVGDGATTLSFNATDTHILEYTATGTPTGFDVTLGNANSSSPNKLLLSGAANGEGQLNLSTDGKYLIVPGYDANVGDLQTTYQTNNKVVAVVGFNGYADYSTRIPGNTINRLVRSAATSINVRIFLTGTNAAPAPGSSTRFLPFGKDTSFASTAFSGAMRSIKMFKTQVYYANNNAVGSLTPNAAANNYATNVPFPGVTVIGHNYQSFYLLDMDATANYKATGYDVLYCADATLGLVKFYWNGTTWIFAGSFNPTSATGVTGGLQDITAKKIGTNSAQIFVVKGAASNNNIISITDASGYNGNISTTPPSATNLTNAGANYMFRGIAFTPSHFSLLPIDLLSFSGVLNNNKVLLKWTTAYEANASSFIIERSSNGNDFSAIGNVSATNNVHGSSYEFEDKQLLSGQALYRLKALDKDGSVKYSDVIAINNKLSTVSNLLIFPNPAINYVTVTYPTATAEARLSIYDINGKKISDQMIAKGSTQRSVDVTKLVGGVYRMVYQNGKQTMSENLVK